MREGFVGFGHAVRVFPFFDGIAFVFRGGDQFIGEFNGNRFAFSGAGGIDQPAHSQCQSAFWADFFSDLIVSSSDSARTDFNKRAGILNSEGENL